MLSLVEGTTMEILRKGGMKDVAYQYTLPSQLFLYGPLHEERSFGAFSDINLCAMVSSMSVFGRSI